ncbi:MULTISPECIES: hypothetical protein [unclassified Campylobacter]|nr:MULTISPECIES: hypothetical protein [unclassified Campylobacter]MDA3062892.1 hypothetical protein [Campylobacter sp. JMF_14 EL1]MDA3074047.1 hypothetical protein [Campylobacter sp. JMF_10 EL2]
MKKYFIIMVKNGKFDKYTKFGGQGCPPYNTINPKTKEKKSAVKGRKTNV